MAETTRLAFDARITAVAIKPGKDNGAKNKFDLGLTIEQPEAPRPPNIPWEFAEGADRSKWKPRPQLPKRKQGETDGDYEARCEPATQERERYDAGRMAYQEKLQGYVKALASHRARLTAYAQLVGIASAFGNRPVNVVITPADQDLLPGFAAELIPAVSELEAELPFD